MSDDQAADGPDQRVGDPAAVILPRFVGVEAKPWGLVGLIVFLAHVNWRP
jgi:hypothetical protein